MARKILIGSVLALAAGALWAFQASKFSMQLAGPGGIRTNTLLFDSVAWLMPLGAVLGMVLAAAEGTATVEVRQGLILRHDEETPFEHWTAALAVLVLSVTGVCLGGLFMPRLVQLPEATGFTMNLHFVGAVVFLVAVSYHLTRRAFGGDLPAMLPRSGDLAAIVARIRALAARRPMPFDGKHLAGQRLAYLVAAVLAAALVLTGGLKAIAHVWALPGALKGSVTVLHDVSALAMMLLLAGHLVVPPTCVSPVRERGAHA